jgi:signal transduction histidine kinase
VFPFPCSSSVAPDSLARFGRDLLWVILGNCGIALFLTVVGDYDGWTNLVYSQSIGLAIVFAIAGLTALRRKTLAGLGEVLWAIPLGGIAGWTLAGLLLGYDPLALVRSHPHALALSMASALLFGLLFSLIFLHRQRWFVAQAEVQEEKLRRAEQQRLLQAAELQLLQAQIEPHFLFNTLSTVLSLIEPQPAEAQAMLLHLTTLLRGSLRRNRQLRTSLADELALIRAYLQIMHIRMGERLQWTLDVPEDLENWQLPPLLLQPLVENAIQHGLEPQEHGGSLWLTARRMGDGLCIEVCDDGRGLAAGPARLGQGLGLDNIRRRLAANYGSAAALSVSSRSRGGVAAVLHLPWDDGLAVGQSGGDSAGDAMPKPLENAQAAASETALESGRQSGQQSGQQSASDSGRGGASCAS